MQRVFIFCYFVVMGVLACFLKGKYAEGKAVPAPKPDRRGAARRAARRRGLEHFCRMCASRWKARTCTRSGKSCSIRSARGALCSTLRSSRCCFSPAPWKSAAGRSDRKCSPFFLMGNFVFLFFTSERIQPTHLTQGFLLLLTVASVWCFNRKSGCMEKYRTKGSRAAIGIIAVYASLASFAQRFFLDGNTRMHFSLPGLFLCFERYSLVHPVIWLLLFALEWFSARPRTLPKPGSRKKALCVLLIALLLCQVFVLWVEWPGGFPLDAIDQYHQALGITG